MKTPRVADVSHAVVETARFVYRHWLSFAILLIIIVASVSLALGYRPGPGLTVVRTGTMVIKGLPARSVVYVDTTKRATSLGTTVTLAMVPGSHTVIVDAPGDEPWSDLVSITSRRQTDVSPILVSKSAEKHLLTTPQDSLKAQLTQQFQRLPTDDDPLSLRNSCTLLYVSQNRLLAIASSSDSCHAPSFLCIDGDCSPTVVYAPRNPIRSVIPFPGRSDAALISYDDVVAVIELDPAKPQYFAPIFTGTAPTAIPWSDSSVVISDRGSSYEVTLPTQP